MVTNGQETVGKVNQITRLYPHWGVGALVLNSPTLPRFHAGAGYPAFPRGGRLPRPRPTQCASQGQIPISLISLWAEG